MKPKVDFYVLDSEAEKARDLLVCKIANKAFLAQQSVYIHCQDQQQAVAFDDMLWSFNDISFIPHALNIADNRDNLPILIGYQSLPQPPYDILLNLAKELPTPLENIKRIIEIVYQDQAIKKTGRTHYKAYQALDFPLKSHQL